MRGDSGVMPKRSTRPSTTRELNPHLMPNPDAYAFYLLRLARDPNAKPDKSMTRAEAEAEIARFLDAPQPPKEKSSEATCPHRPAVPWICYPGPARRALAYRIATLGTMNVSPFTVELCGVGSRSSRSGSFFPSRHSPRISPPHPRSNHHPPKPAPPIEPPPG